MPAARRMQSYLPGLGMLGCARGVIRQECALILAAAVLASLVSPSGAAQELRYGTFRWEQVNDCPIRPSVSASLVSLLTGGGQPALLVLAPKTTGSTRGQGACTRRSADLRAMRVWVDAMT
jgi:hypothetical protein